MKIIRNLCILLTALCCSEMVLANNGEKVEKTEKKSAEGAVHGYVTDAVTKKPVTGIKVSVAAGKQPVQKELQSDGTGHFNFGKIPAGEVVLLLEKKGYKLFKSDILYVKDGSTTSISIAVIPDCEADGGDEIWNPLYKFIDTIIPFE